jgi:hypothetical protein
MITDNNVKNLIKPGVKIKTKIFYHNREEVNYYTIKEIITMGDGVLKFKDKNNRVRMIGFDQIIAVLKPR